MHITNRFINLYSSVNKTVIETIKQCYHQYAGHMPTNIEILPLSGSNRQYYRVYTHTNSIIATYNEDQRENSAFLHLSQVFANHQLPVPTVLYTAPDKNIYFQTDLGNEQLFDVLVNEGEDAAKALYKLSILQLISLQTSATDHINYSHCYPRPEFDAQSIQWDLNYFKYYFLKLAGVAFDEELLETDFRNLIAFLTSYPPSVFMLRDCKSKNIMINNNKPYFIDYQGGRKGYPQYDLASLMYEAITGLSESFRHEMLAYYKQHFPFDKSTETEEAFDSRYYHFALLRIMQAMGAYGYRGFFEQKQMFLQSIPSAIENTRWLLAENKISKQFPYLLQCLKKLIHSTKIKEIIPVNFKNLTVEITSFSFRKGYPPNRTGNGGGHVFDCRALPNPGRYAQYKTLTGKDHEVIRFLQEKNEVSAFLNNTLKIISQSINTYHERNFTSLQVSFGCTGGQHRSVYCAEYAARLIKQNHRVEVIVKHREQDQL